MSKNKGKEEFYIVKKEDVTKEQILVRFDIHVYLDKEVSHYLHADTRKKAESKVTSLWMNGRTEGLAVNRDLLVAITVTPRYVNKHSFEQYKIRNL